MALSVFFAISNINIVWIVLSLGFVITLVGKIRLYQIKAFENKLIQNYQGEIINHLLSGYKHEYSKNKYIDLSILKNSGFIQKKQHYDFYNGEDYLTINIPNNDGTSSNCDLILSDICVKVIRGYFNVFGIQLPVKEVLYNAMFGYVEFPFQFNCTLTINAPFYSKKGLEKLELESIAFNDNFKMYSSDQVVSRYILNPHMMQKITSLNDKMNNLMIVIDKNFMCIGCKNKRLFKQGKLKRGKEYEIFSEIYEDIVLVTSLVEEIRCNDKVFRM